MLCLHRQERFNLAKRITIDTIRWEYFCIESLLPYMPDIRRNIETQSGGVHVPMPHRCGLASCPKHHCHLLANLNGQMVISLVRPINVLSSWHDDLAVFVSNLNMTTVGVQTVSDTSDTGHQSVAGVTRLKPSRILLQGVSDALIKIHYEHRHVVLQHWYA